MNHFSDLVGKTLKRVEKESSDRIVFELEDGTEYLMWHNQDCCESVYVEDINGELDWLVGAPILQAEETTNANENPEGVKPPEEWQESWTWTFYRISTIKGTVVIRWYGSSNGCYSESVDFEKKGAQ